MYDSAHLFTNGGAHSVSSKGCFRKRFEIASPEQRDVTKSSVLKC